jgi:hypothetical protein
VDAAPDSFAGDDADATAISGDVADSGDAPSREVSADAAAAVLTIDKNAASFAGFIGCEGPVHEFLVRNTGGSPSGVLTVAIDPRTDFLAAPGGCDGRVLAPGEACGVAVRFRPTALGARSATLSVRAHPGGELAANLAGVAVSGGDSLEVTPNPLDFGEVTMGITSAPRTLMVRHVGDKAVTFKSVSLAPTSFAISRNGCDGRTLAGGESCPIEVTFTPETTGASTAVLVVSTGGDCGGASAVANLTGQGVSLEIDKREIDFGGWPVGGCKESRVGVTVRNNGSLPTGPLKIASSGPFSVENDGCAGTSLPAQGSCRLVLAFIPVAVGAGLGALEVSASPGGSAKSALEGLGVAASGLVLRLSPNVTADLHDFGAVAVGTKSPGVKVEVRNSSICTADNITMAVSGANQAQFSVEYPPVCTTLPPSSVCDATVFYAPTAPGKHTATINASAASSGSASRVLTGEGI